MGVPSVLFEIKNLFFPLECLGCATPGDFLCRNCLTQCLPPAHLTCPSCNYRSPVGGVHPRCSKAYAIDGIFAAGSLKEPLMHLAIKRLKYANVKDLSKPLALFLAMKLKENFEQFILNQNFCITFVPLHPKREQKRGYNQSELLAKNLSLLTELPITSAIARTKDTEDQTKLKKEQRTENVKSAFKLAPETEVKNKNFFIVDDVTTTGSTLKECAKVLKRNGANLVWGLAVARE